MTGYQNGAMDGFNLIPFINGELEGKLPYQYVKPATIKPYWAIAKQWGLANDMFQTQGSDSFTAHQDLIRGGTFIDATHSLIDPPTSPLTPGDVTQGPGFENDADHRNRPANNEKNTGPFPCTDEFPDYGSNGYQTLRDLLDAKSGYRGSTTPRSLKRKSRRALECVRSHRSRSLAGRRVDRTGHIASPETSILKDISERALQGDVVGNTDAQETPDHPGVFVKGYGPVMVAGHRQRDQAKATDIWDNYRGDRSSGMIGAASTIRLRRLLPRDNQGGPGFRVPMLVVSPYVKIGSGTQGGYISNTVYVLRQHHPVHRGYVEPGAAWHDRLNEHEHGGYVRLQPIAAFVHPD